MNIADKPDALAALAVLQAAEHRDLADSDLDSLEIEPLLIEAMKSGEVTGQLSASSLDRRISSVLAGKLAAGWLAGTRVDPARALHVRVSAPSSLVMQRTQLLLGSAAHEKSICFLISPLAKGTLSNGPFALDSCRTPNRAG